MLWDTLSSHQIQIRNVVFCCLLSHSSHSFTKTTCLDFLGALTSDSVDLCTDGDGTLSEQGRTLGGGITWFGYDGSLVSRRVPFAASW